MKFQNLFKKCYVVEGAICDKSVKKGTGVKKDQNLRYVTNEQFLILKESVLGLPTDTKKALILKI